MNCQELLYKVNKGQLDNVYLFYGKENFLIDNTLKNIIDLIIDPSHSAFNLEKAYARDVTPYQIVNMAQTLPLLGGKRVVIIKDIHELKDSNEKGLLSYIKSPSPAVCLIFTSNKPDKINTRKKIYAALTKYGNAVEFKKLYNNQVITWIHQNAKQQGITIHKDASAHLVSSLGNNLQSIDSELKKIITYIGDKKTITLTDVKTVICGIDIKNDTIFSLTDAIGEKNLKKSLACLNRLIRQKESPQMILSMITRQFRLLLLTKTLQEKCCADKEIIAKLKIKPFLLKKLKIQGHEFTIQELENCFYSILNTDIALKTTDRHPKMVIESLILDICNKLAY